MQSPVPSQQQQPQPATQWVVAAPRPTTVPNYKHRQSIFLGVTLITVGTLSIVFNIIDLAVWSSNRRVTSFGLVGHGIWSGCMCVIAGGFGVGAGRRKSWCLVRSFLVLCIIAAVFCLAQFAVAVAGAAISGSQYNENDDNRLCCTGNCSYWPYQDPPTRSPTSVCQEAQTVIAMESLLAIMAFIGGLAAIWGSALGCRDCCCPDQYPQRFAIVQDNETRITVPAQTQQQTGNMTSVAMQYPNTNPPPYPVDGYQFPDVPPEYSPPSTDLVSPPQLPPLPEVVQHHASASVSLQPSAPPDYKS